MLDCNGSAEDVPRGSALHTAFHTFEALGKERLRFVRRKDPAPWGSHEWESRALLRPSRPRSLKTAIRWAQCVSGENQRPRRAVETLLRCVRGRRSSPA